MWLKLGLWLLKASAGFRSAFTSLRGKRVSAIWIPGVSIPAVIAAIFITMSLTSPQAPQYTLNLEPTHPPVSQWLKERPIPPRIITEYLPGEVETRECTVPVGFDGYYTSPVSAKGLVLSRQTRNTLTIPFADMQGRFREFTWEFDIPRLSGVYGGSFIIVHNDPYDRWTVHKMYGVQVMGLIKYKKLLVGVTGRYFLSPTTRIGAPINSVPNARRISILAHANYKFW